LQARERNRRKAGCAREADAVERALRVRARPPPPLLLPASSEGGRKRGCIYVGSAAATPQSATWSGPEQPSGDHPCCQVRALCHQPQVVRCVLVLHRTPAPPQGGHPTNKASRLCMWVFSHLMFFLVFSACVSFSLTHSLSLCSALSHCSPVPLLSQSVCGGSKTLLCSM
jgi:hypothetical protein